MYQIRKQFAFSASHQLTGLPDDHQCARLHGHNYIVEIVLESLILNEVGFVRDFGELKAIKDWLDEMFDHKHLNDVLLFNPTSECLAEFIYAHWYSKFLGLKEVRVSETPTSWASFCL